MTTPSILRLMWLWLKISIALFLLSLLWAIVIYPIIKLIDWVYCVTRTKIWTYIIASLIMVWVYYLIGLMI